MPTACVCVIPLVAALVSHVNCFNWNTLDLPEEHIPYYFFNNPKLKAKCVKDPDCPFKAQTKIEKCWGYEKNCKRENRMNFTVCDGPGWGKSKTDQETTFWEQGDFGHILPRIQMTETICYAKTPKHSFLQCSDNARYCYGRNIFIDFSTANIKSLTQPYRENLIHEGEVGGHCSKFYAGGMRTRGAHKSFLQSWFGELEHFENFEEPVFESGKCDVIYDKPTVLFKLDAAVNLYHHYCDFVNLYASQHINNSFSKDIKIVAWDTARRYTDGLFGETWEAFTDYPLDHIVDLDGKRVCFRNVMFPLLARQRLGLYYNMPVIPGCRGSSLFRAFHQHLMHRLKIKQHGPLKKKIRVTLMARNTKYRNILNQDELVQALEAVDDYEFKVVNYHIREMTFKKQIESTLNSDVFIGMHGAGLTHTLFQPDWGALFEVSFLSSPEHPTLAGCFASREIHANRFNCGDAHCYDDLTRLRGAGYFTWEKHDKLVQEDQGHHPTLGAHQKFTNYSFDVTEFLRIVRKCANHVKNHPAFRAARREKFNKKQNKNKDEL